MQDLSHQQSRWGRGEGGGILPAKPQKDEAEEGDELLHGRQGLNWEFQTSQGLGFRRNPPQTLLAMVFKIRCSRLLHKEDKEDISASKLQSRQHNPCYKDPLQITTPN